MKDKAKSFLESLEREFGAKQYQMFRLRAQADTLERELGNLATNIALLKELLKEEAGET